MTMQKVACPITIVQSDGLMWWNGLFEKNELSAIPVTTPGSAIGKTSRKLTASRPKKRKRLTAAAAAVPSTSATNVATPAAFIDRTSASRASWFCQAARNHFVEKPAIGQLWMFDELNADTQMNTRRTQGHNTTSGAHGATPMRRPRLPSQRVSRA